MRLCFRSLALSAASLLLCAPASLAAAPLKVVAAENFYGNIVSQLGGPLVNVTSLLSDPNIDPHEYESSVAAAKAVAKANLILENSGGYDDWMDKLLAASPNPERVVLKGFDLAPRPLPDNEHVWYDTENIAAVSHAITAALTKLDPAGRTEFERNLTNFLASLQKISEKIASLRTQLEGTPIALTETIFLYQAGPLGLRVLTPFEFQKSVAEGEEPPAALAVVAEHQIQQRQVKALVFNVQTSTAETAKLQNLAKAAGIPVVAVTETMPQGQTYQSWMLAQLERLQQALLK